MSNNVIATVKGEFIFRLFKEINKATLAEDANGGEVSREGSEVFFFYGENGFGVFARSLERSFLFVDSFEVMFDIRACNKGRVPRRCIESILDFFEEESTWNENFSMKVNSYGTVYICLPEEEEAFNICRDTFSHDHSSHINETVIKARRFFATGDNNEVEVPLGFLAGKYEDMDVRLVMRSQSRLTEGRLKYMSLHPIKLAAKASKLNEYFFVGGAVELQESKMSWK